MRRLLTGLGVALLLIGVIAAAGLFPNDLHERSINVGPIDVESAQRLDLPRDHGFALLALGAVLVGAGALLRR